MFDKKTKINVTKHCLTKLMMGVIPVNTSDMHMYTSDPNPVPVTYDNQELLGIVDKFLSEMDGEFSYKGVCRYVVNEAKRNDKVEGAPHTKYSSSDISIVDGIRISKILWEKIWNKEIFVAFGDNPYRGVGKNDTRFYKL